MAQPIRPESRRILVVSKDDELLAAVADVLAGDVQLETSRDPQAALEILKAGEHAGLVADSRLPGRLASSLAECFLGATTSGRAVLVASLDDPDTLMRLNQHGGRLEIIFRPWNDWELRTRVLGRPYEAATGTDG